MNRDPKQAAFIESVKKIDAMESLYLVRALESFSADGGFSYPKNTRGVFTDTDILESVLRVCRALLKNIAYGRTSPSVLSPETARTLSESVPFISGFTLDELDMALRMFLSPDKGSAFPDDAAREAARASLRVLVSETYDRTDRIPDENFSTDDDTESSEDAFFFVETVHTPLSCSLDFIGRLMTEGSESCKRAEFVRGALDGSVFLSSFLEECATHSEWGASAREIAAAFLVSVESGRSIIVGRSGDRKTEEALEILLSFFTTSLFLYEETEIPYEVKRQTERLAKLGVAPESVSGGGRYCAAVARVCAACLEQGTDESVVL